MTIEYAGTSKVLQQQFYLIEKSEQDNKELGVGKQNKKL